MSGIKKSNRNLILLLVGLVILLLTYFLVFNNAQNETEKIESELGTQKVYLEELEAFKADEATYLEGIETDKKIVAEISAHLPADVRTEDYILYLLDMEEKTGVQVDSISMNDKSVVSEFDCMIDGETKTAAGGQVNASVVAEMDYEQLKDMLSYISDTNNATYVDTISVAYDSASAKLGVVSDMNMLYLDYDGASYSPKSMPVVNKGLEDLFGTINTNELVGEVSEAEEAPEAED